MRTRTQLVLPLAVTAALLILQPAPASAQPAPQYCGPADIVFVVDDTFSTGPVLTSLQNSLSLILDQIAASTDPGTGVGPDYRVALVTFKDNVTVRLNFAANNRDALTPLVNALVASAGGAGSGNASDEALRTVINLLPASARLPGQQSGDFNVPFRNAVNGVGVRKIIVLLTGYQPGGFDDDFRVEDITNAHQQAVDAAAAAIKIDAIYTRVFEAQAGADPIMMDYASVTGGTYVRTDDPVVQDPGTVVLDVLSSCPAVNKPPRALCGDTWEITPANCSPVPSNINNGSYDPEDDLNVILAQSPLGPYAVGATLVTLTVTDTQGASASCQATVTVDCPAPLPPSVTVPPDMVEEATGPLGKVVTFAATAQDYQGNPLDPTCAPASGSTFPLGATTVICTATDANGTGTASFMITVRDTTPPALTLPAPISVSTTNPAGTAVSFTVTAADLVDPAPSVSCMPASGSTFGVGTTTVSCTARDGAGNTSLPATFTVTVTLTDTTPPVVTVPASFSVEATGPTGALASFSASAVDNVDGPLTPTCLPASGGTFPLGTTLVTCSATDAHTNTGSATFTITVVDTTPPTLTVPTVPPVVTTDPAGATVTYAAAASDLVDGAITPVCAPASGTLFPVGTTTVTCTATDAHTNTATGTFPVTVTLTDTTPPVVTVPASFSVEATGPTGALASFSASAVDNLDGPLTPTCLPASGSTFPLGSTVVTCSATDAHTNTGSATFTITVIDSTPPVLTLPTLAPLEVLDPAATVAVTYVASASDLVDGSVTPVCVPASGSSFGVGTTPVTCTATDLHGNAATGIFDVVVRFVDRIAPIVTITAPATVEATGPSGAPVTFTASATDNVDGVVAVTCDRVSGSVFPLGPTTISCFALDAAGNRGEASGVVTVADMTSPVLTLPTLAPVEVLDPAATVAVTYVATATDLVDGSVMPVCAPPSGSSFGVGTTPVTCTATDLHGNAASGTFDVVVRFVDRIAPIVTITAPATVEATGPSGAPVTFTASAIDNVDGVVAVTCDRVSGSTFPLGSTTISCVAVDAAGNRSEASAVVTVVDTTAPTLTLPAFPPFEVLDPASTMVVTYLATASDLVDGSVTPVCAPPSGSSFGVGTTPVTCTATDLHGNAASGTFDVVVRFVDRIAPIVTITAPASVEATGPAGAVVTFSVSAIDNVDGAVAVTCDRTSGSTFSLGPTTISCFALDAASNRGEATAVVTVADTTAPSLTLPADVTLTAFEPSGVTYAFTATARDLVDGSIVPLCVPASGSMFPVGSNTVSCSATDARGNRAEGSFRVTVQYTPPNSPVVACLAGPNPGGVMPAGTSADGFFRIVGNDGSGGTAVVLTFGSFVLRNGETIKITRSLTARGVRLVNVMTGIRHFLVGPNDEIVVTDMYQRRATTRCAVPR